MTAKGELRPQRLGFMLADNGGGKAALDVIIGMYLFIFLLKLLFHAYAFFFA